MNFSKNKCVATTLVLSCMAALALQADDQPSTAINTSSNHDKDLKGAYYLPSTQDFFAYADYLLWKPVLEADDLAVTSNKFTNLVTNNPEYQVIDRNNSRLPYASGFRVGVGYRFPVNYLSTKVRPWQMEASYERIYTAAHQQGSAPGITSLSGSKANSGKIYNGELDNNGSFVVGRIDEDLVNNISYIVNRYKSSKYLGYNRADFKLSWPFWIADNIILKVGPGATFGYLDYRLFQFEHQNAYPGSIFSGSQVSGDYNYKYSSNWWGGGLSGFADIHFEVGKGFGFFIDTSAAFMYGKNETTIYGSYPTNYAVKSKSDAYLFQPVVKAAVGVDYKRWFGSVQMYMNAGWEYNYWFYGQLSNGNSLSFTGLTTRLGVAF